MAKYRITKRFEKAPEGPLTGPGEGYRRGPMVITPWGDSAELRARKLPPGRSTPREAVRRNQRERLLAATVASVGERGYEATRVADLVELSGVSRRAFYEHFDNKLDCFLATLEEVLRAATELTVAGMSREGSWEERARAGMESFVEMLVSQPAAARLCLVEAHAAGPEATQRLTAALDAFEALMQRTFEEDPQRRGMPPEMTRAMIGGMRKVIHTRLHRHAEGELIDLLPDLLQLGLSYRPPPRRLRPPRRKRRGGAEGGAATARVSDADPAERIVRATMAVVAEKGFQEARIDEIAEAAGISLSTFYRHFDGKAEAFDAALYSGRTRMLSVLLPVFRRARSWPDAVRGVTEVTFDFLSREPEFAHLMTVDVYSAGPEALERRDRAIEAVLWTLDPGFEYAPELQPVVREAILSGIYAMLGERIEAKGVESVPAIAPLATYVALSPFIGAEAAAAVANGTSWTEVAS